MRKLLLVFPLVMITACGDKDEDTGDTSVEDAEENTIGDE